MPDLETNEYNRERDFYRDRGLPCPKDQVVEQEEDNKEEEMTPDANTNMDFHRFDEQVNPNFFNLLIKHCVELPGQRFML